MASLTKKALFSIVFFQAVLTPYMLFIVGLDWPEYYRWTIGNVMISPILGPLFLKACERVGLG